MASYFVQAKQVNQKRQNIWEKEGQRKREWRKREEMGVEKVEEKRREGKEEEREKRRKNSREL